MLKKLTIATMVGAMSLASIPLMTNIASAQDKGPEPMTAPDPSDSGGASADKAAPKSGAMMSKKKGGGSMMSKKSMMKKKSMKKKM